MSNIGTKVRIQNPFQFIDYSKENCIAVVYYREVEDVDIRLHNSSHSSKQVSNSTSCAGKVFIWYERCL